MKIFLLLIAITNCQQTMKVAPSFFDMMDMDNRYLKIEMEAEEKCLNSLQHTTADDELNVYYIEWNAKVSEARAAMMLKEEMYLIEKHEFDDFLNQNTNITPIL
jgi:hypothetical protein